MTDFIVTKPFLRGGQRLRRGDPLPSGVDGPTLADYRRLGMIGPAETKPASHARNTRKPKEKPVDAKPAVPAETQQAAPPVSTDSLPAEASGAAEKAGTSESEAGVGS